MPRPARPKLGRGEVHVWLADLQGVGEVLLGSLSQRERERASHIISPRRRELWMRSRAVLRDLLACYLDADPLAVPLDNDGRGRLVLIGGEKRRHGSRPVPKTREWRDCGLVPARPTLHVSVSH